MTYLILISAALVCGMVLLAGRWKRCVAGAVVSAALVAGCATATPENPVMTFACAPDGLPVIDSSWQTVDIRTGMATETESGRPVAMTMVALVRGRQALLLTFIGEDLVLVDLDPDDPGVPLLANARFITPQVKIKTKPGGDCAWFPILEPGDQA